MTTNKKDDETIELQKKEDYRIFFCMFVVYFIILFFLISFCSSSFSIINEIYWNIRFKSRMANKQISCPSVVTIFENQNKKQTDQE